MTYITAHSGCEGTPAGSMESITRALELGANFIEVDVRRSPEQLARDPSISKEVRY